MKKTGILFSILYLLFSGCSSAEEDALPDFGTVESKTVIERMFGSDEDNKDRLFITDYQDFPKFKARGEYLVKVTGCGSCHGDQTIDPQSPLSGGFLLSDRFGTVASANITPDLETGIGKWKVVNIIRAIRSSRGKDDSYLSVDVHSPYKWLADSDLKAISAYLLLQNPVNKKIERRLLSGFERRKWGMISQHEEFSGYVPRPSINSSGSYGRYLTHNAARCYQCHTSEGGVIESAVPFAGGEKKGRSIFASLKKLSNSFAEIAKGEDSETKKQNVQGLLSTEAKKEYFTQLDDQRLAEALQQQPKVLVENKLGINPANDQKITEGLYPFAGPDIRGKSEKGLLSWSKEQIISYLSTGITPSNEIKDARLCPWPYFKKMSKLDKEAVANYLKQQ